MRLARVVVSIKMESVFHHYSKERKGENRMVMLFENEKARRQLLKKGEVFTWRKKKRMKNFGEDWAAHKRGGAKIATIYISYFGKVLPRELGEFVDRSGFKTLQEWIEAILKFNKAEEEGHLYHVRNLNIEL